MPLNKAVNVDASTATFGSYNPSVLSGGILDLYGYTSALRSNITINGGGNISTTGGYLSWSYRFIVMQAGTRGSSFATNGYFDIFMPPVGTLVPGIGGAADRFVESGGILLNAWESLFYILPIGASNPTVNANFRVVAYTTHNFDIPPNWVRICTKNGDTGIYHMSNGANIATGDISYSGMQTISATAYTVPSRDASGNLWSSGIAQHDATSTMTPYTAIKSSSTRANDLSPNTYAWGLFSEFKNTSFAGVTSGSYGGLLTYAVWNGTTVSTGDPSYQLLFHPQGANSTLPPVLKIRAGIDTTWGSWSTILHSSNVTSFASAPAGDLLTAADWNTYTAQGMYRYGRIDWTGVTNNPSASAYTYGTLDIISSGTNAVTQVYYTHSATSGMYFRSKWNASDWQSWIQVLDNSASNQVKSGNLTATAFIPSGSTVPTNGMYLSAANTLNFATNTTNRMSIDSSGNVGIGGSPIAANGRLSVIGGRTYLAANSETYSLGLMYSSSTGQYYVGATNAAAPDLVFSNSGGTERMRITDAGNVGIGITPGYKLDVAGVGRFKSGTEWPVIVQNNSATSTNRNHIIFQRDNNGAAVTANFNLGGIGMAGYDGASYGLGWNGGIEISGFAAETWTSAARGSYLTITTTPTGTITPQERLRIDAAGNVGIGAAPSASYILDIQKTGSGTSTGIRVYNSATAASSGARIDLQQGAVNTFVDSVSNATGRVGTSTNHPLQIITNNTERIGITAAGVTTVSGVALGTTATNESIISNMFLTTSNADYIRAKYRRVSNGSDWQTAQAKIQRVVDVTDMGYLGFGGTSTYDVRIGSGTSDIAIFAPSSITLGSDSVKTTAFPADGTTSTAAAAAGYMGLPQNSRSSAYTLAATDAGKHLYITTNGQTITIPANGTTAFPIGTTIIIVNANGVSTSIAITTDTLRLANSTSTGTRTLASNGMCTLLKVTATEWIASGNGLT